MMGKLFILIVSTSFLFVGVVKGQSDRVGGESYFGVKAGPNYSNVTGLNGAYILRGHIGVYGGYMIDDNLAIQPELLFSMQGVRGYYSKLYTGEKTNLNNSYLALPIIFKYYVIEGFNLQAGPQIGFAISKKKANLIEAGSETTFKGRGSEERGSGFVNQSFEPSSFDFGVAMGWGYDIDENWNIDVRYILGLKKVYGKKDVVSNKNSLLQMGIGYTF